MRGPNRARLWDGCGLNNGLFPNHAGGRAPPEMRTIRRHEAIGWTAGALSVVGTVALALVPRPDVVRAVWLFWAASQVLWIWYARETDSRPLLWA